MKALKIPARLLSVLLIIFAASAAFADDGVGGGASLPREKIVILSKDGDRHVSIADAPRHVFDVEIATAPGDLARGLMHRTELAADSGMLFVFPDETLRFFWMKNTLIPLDMLFIRADGTIHHIHENAAPHDLTNIPSNGPVSRVLEINGGTAAKLGIRPGDVVYNKTYFGNELAR